MRSYAVDDSFDSATVGRGPAARLRRSVRALLAVLVMAPAMAVAGAGPAAAHHHAECDTLPGLTQNVLLNISFVNGTRTPDAAGTGLFMSPLTALLDAAAGGGAVPALGSGPFGVPDLTSLPTLMSNQMNSISSVLTEQLSTVATQIPTFLAATLTAALDVVLAPLYVVIDAIAVFSELAGVEMPIPEELSSASGLTSFIPTDMFDDLAAVIQLPALTDVLSSGGLIGALPGADFIGSFTNILGQGSGLLPSIEPHLPALNPRYGAYAVALLEEISQFLEDIEEMIPRVDASAAPLGIGVEASVSDLVSLVVEMPALFLHLLKAEIAKSNAIHESCVNVTQTETGERAAIEGVLASTGPAPLQFMLPVSIPGDPAIAGQERDHATRRLTRGLLTNRTSGGAQSPLVTSPEAWTVETVVAQTIADLKAVGQLNNSYAQTYYDKALVELGNKNYKIAFKYFRQAYQYAVNQP